MGEVFNLTPGKATNENDTLAERAAEQLGEAAAALHDQQSRRKARKGKKNRRDEEQRRKTRTTKGKKGKAKHKGGNGAGRRARDSLWADPDETPRHSLVRLFDGSRSGGSTPLVPSSDEEPNTDDRAFIADDVGGDSDPLYEPTDEEDEELRAGSNPEEETKADHPAGGEWFTDGDGDQVWVPEENGGGGPEGDPFADIFGHGGGPGAAHTPKKKKSKKKHLAITH